MRCPICNNKLHNFISSINVIRICKDGHNHLFYCETNGDIVNYKLSFDYVRTLETDRLLKTSKIVIRKNSQITNSIDIDYQDIIDLDKIYKIMEMIELLE